MNYLLYFAPRVETETAIAETTAVYFGGQNIHDAMSAFPVARIITIRTKKYIVPVKITGRNQTNIINYMGQMYYV